MANNEFLPLCDVLFNIISLLWYFCNVVFDLVFSYALYSHKKYLWFSASLSFIILSLVINQVISLKCYLKRPQSKLVLESKYSVFKRFLIMGIHVAQCGVIWRYLKLFVPVDIRYVKHEVRDLCMLRLIHAFCEAAPLLLMQLYLLLKEPETKELGDLMLVTSVLSLFSMCWALASFSKNVRVQNVHRLVFTWMGVIFQLLWRLGTVGSRVSALMLYATLYREWLFLVLGLHWMSMFLWLISPKNVFHGEKISKYKKVAFSILIAFVYIFSYINLQQVKHRQKMVSFYTVMLLENTLLVAVWLAGVWPNFNVLVPLLIMISFILGISFMCLYYKVFHVRRLTYWSTSRQGGCEYTGNIPPLARNPNKAVQASEDGKQLTDLNKLLRQNLALNYREKIPGVFNCRFSSPYANTAKRKKKKPTTFVPPPSFTILPSNNSQQKVKSDVENKRVNSLNLEYCFHDPDKTIPFWRRPLPGNNLNTGSEIGGNSLGSRVNIRHKLQEKKEKQLAELKVIEEEIKQGKIPRTNLNTTNVPQSSLQPIPRTKRHVESLMLSTNKPLSSSLRGFTYQLFPPPVRWHYQTTDPPEILLAPHYLDSDEWDKHNEGVYTMSDDERTCSVRSSHDNVIRNKPPDVNYNTFKIASDVDSQISLPRSYTLPRAFKYYKTRKNFQNHFITSTNSSDGDVDSPDESSIPSTSVARRKLRQYPHRQVTHETKL